MKFYIYIFSIFVSALFVSCSEDDKTQSRLFLKYYCCYYSRVFPLWYNFTNQPEDYPNFRANRNHSSICNLHEYPVGY